MEVCSDQFTYARLDVIFERLVSRPFEVRLVDGAEFVHGIAKGCKDVGKHLSSDVDNSWKAKGRTADNFGRQERRIAKKFGMESH